MTVQELALADLNDHRLFTFLDLAGTFAFAISGAVAARARGLDGSASWSSRSWSRAAAVCCATCASVPCRRPGWLSGGRTWIVVMACLALRYKWNLPRSSGHDDNGSD